MDELLERVKRTIGEHRLLEVGDRVLVAVSGGPDSVALLRVLQLLEPEFGLSLRVLHINHGLRGEESDREERFVADLAERLGIPAESVRISLADLAGSGQGSLQQVGREVRYQLLQQAAERWRCSRIGLGHHADDQAETILEHLLRGSGREGLTGMPYRRGPIVRPLLDVTRREIEAFLQRQQLEFCVDSSNLKPVYRRNRLRLELIPLLKREYNPGLVEGLNRMAALLRDEEELLEELAGRAASGMGVVFDRDRVRIPVAELLRQPVALQRRILRRALQRLAGQPGGVYYEQVARLRELAANPASGRVAHLAGDLQGRREYQWLVLEHRRRADREGYWEHPLQIPGRTRLPEIGAVVEAEIGEAGPPQGDDPNRVVLDLDRVSFPIFARSRRPGDRFYPLGLEGSQKVKKFFIDHKVPREARERAAVIGSGGDIYWLAGWRADARFAAGPATSRFLVLTCSREPGEKV